MELLESPEAVVSTFLKPCGGTGLSLLPSPASVQLTSPVGQPGCPACDTALVQELAVIVSKNTTQESQVPCFRKKITSVPSVSLW